MNNDSKLHCQHCATQRNGRIGVLIKENQDSEEYTPIFLNIKKFNKIRRLEKEFELPSAVFFDCIHCQQKTFYNLNKNRKLEITLS